MGLRAPAGGGVSSLSLSTVVSNCVITGNSSSGGFRGEAYSGGGAYGCTLNNCALDRNRAAYGGGAYACTLNNCALCGNQAADGGGAAYCTLNNCTLSGNSASGNLASGSVSNTGGGASRSTLNNCTLTGNSVAYGTGAGAYDCTLHNCTLAGNSAFGLGPSLSDDVAVGCTLNNCIKFGNSDGFCPIGSPCVNVCWDCDSSGRLDGNNWVGDPLFVNTNGWADLRLQSNSPCINAGNNSYVTNATDLDGNPRIAGGTVDIGAYEFQSPVSMISYAWLQHFNLPINPATDTADPDGDGVDNFHEWLAGSDPTNPFSFPPLLTLIPYGVPPSGIILTWPTNAFGFTLQSTTNLGSPSVWSTNSPAPVVIGGQNVITNPITGPQQFFRLKQ
jgi:hypothetical protein